MKNIISYTLLILLLLPSILEAQSIVNTKHNLSVSGPGTIKATNQTEVCIFCHTPHNSAPQGPLWNRTNPGVTYTLYTSSTMQAIPGQPDGSSILCLSCHDGTIALGNVLSLPVPISFNSGISTMPAGNSNLTTDLSDDHPISFVYNSALSSSDPQLKDPATLSGDVKLENSKMQCITCHDPHSNIISPFLVSTNQNSVLCMICHQMNYWSNTTHSSSAATWTGSGTNPWLHTTYTNVAQNACENCHDPHSAGGKLRLMNYNIEETNCLTCHSGTVAASTKNIQSQLAKTYKHNVAGYLGIHDPTEPAVSNTLHDECQDCHNPHASNATSTVAPFVNGFTTGVKGVDQAGNAINPAVNMYEICYRCHADSPNKPGPSTARWIVQNNVRLEFAPGNPSFHPVAAIGVNPNVPSLIAPLTTASRIYCTDCHASDGTGAPKGPHGSIYPQILKSQYSKVDNSSESAAKYALCYSCHSRTSIKANASFARHNLHIGFTPCNTCHDPHGIASSQGNATNNSKLINFNSGIVSASPSAGGTPVFVSTGVFHGYCTLQCHGEDHQGSDYNY